VPLEDHGTGHPTTARLVIEVSDSSLKKDRSKAAVYAGAGIAEYWIVNLAARTIEVHSSPEGDRYAETRTVREGETLRPVALPDVAIAVAEILPKA
jgi:Uma2 family endonuclease